MAFIRQNSVQPFVRQVGPVTPRRRRVGAPLGAIQPDANLTRYPNGAPLKTLGSYVRVAGPTRGAQGRPMLSGLRGYEPAPDLTQYTNGRPLPTVGSQTPKAALVMMAFDHCMSKKKKSCPCGSGVTMMSKHRRRGMSGLGDDGSDVQDISDAANAIEDTVDNTASETIDTGSSTATPYTGPLLISGTGPMTQIAGAPGVAVPTAATAGSALSNLFRSLFGSGTTYTVPAYSSIGATGLSSPLYAGSSVSTGGALLLGGGLLLLVLAMKKR